MKLKGKGGSGEDESYRYSVPVKNDARRMSYVVYVLTKELGREREDEESKKISSSICRLLRGSLIPSLTGDCVIRRRCT